MSGRGRSNRGQNGRGRRKRRGGRKGQRGRRNVGAEQSHVLAVFNHTRIPRSLASNTPFPPQMRRRMRYLDPSLIYKNAANSFFIREFRVNSLFDPDPLLGGGSVSGYGELSQMYNRNIVTHIRMRAVMVNLEPTAVVGAYIIFRDVQPSLLITSFNDAISSAEVAPATRVRMLGTVAGQPKGNLSASIPLASILGRPLEYLTDVGYASNINVDPPQVLWGAVILFAYTPTTFLTNGVSVALSLDFSTNWFSGQKALDLSSPRLEARQRHLDSLMEIEQVPISASIITPIQNTLSNQVYLPNQGNYGPFPGRGKK